MGLNDIWENFFYKEDRKDSKEAKKRKQTQDRSQFKKSDQDKKAKLKSGSEIVSEGLLKGRVVTIGPSQVEVVSGQKSYLCTVRGRLKQKNVKLKSLIAVGDYVHIKPEDPSAFDKKGAALEGVIESVEPRKSLLSRGENLSRHKQQVIAANIDLVIVVASVYAPVFRPALIDRYLIAAEKGNLEAAIAINKVDTLGEIDVKERTLFEDFCEVYEALNYKLFLVSSKSRKGLDALEEFMGGKASVFSGQSGTGKSSLLTAITGEELLVGNTVKGTHKGSHTTVKTRLLPLASGGFCLDTPGIKSFGIWDFQLQDVKKHFFEISEIGEQCRFPDCSHRHEPDCRVKEALESGEVSAIRYQSYEALLEELSSEHKRR